MQIHDKGAMKFPSSLFYQIGRMMHVCSSCVGCGTCEDACPVGIKITQIFSIVADRVQKLFEYTPGKREEPLPLQTFKEDEFKDIAE